MANDHFEFSKTVARQTVSQRKSSIPLDDAIQAGALGLIAAAENFDPDRGVPFEAYARRRIKGAILDLIRSESGFARSIRVKAAEIEAAEHRVMASGFQDFSDFESQVAAELGITKEQLSSYRRHIAASLSVSLDAVEAVNLRSSSAFWSITGNPEEEFARSETIREVLAAIATLPERDRYVVIEYYVSETPLIEIAKELGVSSTRASFIRNRALNKVREKIANDSEGLTDG